MELEQLAECQVPEGRPMRRGGWDQRHGSDGGSGNPCHFIPTWFSVGSLVVAS